MSTLSTSIYGSSTSKGFGGLVSGLDTDDLVNKMLSGTKSKINKQYQAKQKLLYRQQAYREISTKLVSFNNKYFSYSSGSKTNILNSKFFESYNYTSSSKYVNVTGNAQNISNFSIDSIESVASSANFASNKKVTNGTFESEALGAYTSTLAGATMTLDYDGKSYNIKFDKGFGNGDTAVTLSEVASEIQTQLSESGLSDITIGTDGDLLSITGPKGEVKLAAASTGVTESLKIEIGKTAVSTAAVEISKETSSVLGNSNNYITFEFNGVTKKISMDSSVTDPTSLETYLQGKLDAAYGTGKVIADYDDATKKFTFSSANDTDIFGVSSISSELSNTTGIETGDYNRVNKTRSILESGIAGIKDLATTTLSNGKEGFILNINDTNIEIESTMTVTEAINKINNNAEAGVKVYYSSTTDTFTVKAAETGSHKNVSITDVGGEGNLAATLFGTAGIDYTVNAGTDTKMTYTLNGVQNTITRSTSNFTIDEINIELNEKAAGLKSSDEPITFDVTNNADEVVAKFKEFINDYNEIISLISSKTSEKPDRDYQPLTPDQQEEMEKEEIEDWTTQAKKGILYGDNNMNNLLRKMRTSMTGSTSVSSLSLSSIGVSSATMDTSGKLILDESKFKEKLLENPEEIASLFSATTSAQNGTSGLAVQMREILVSNVGAYGTTGILINEAGLDSGMTSDQNNISEKIKDYDDKLDELKDKMEEERERYWNKFSSLEKTLNNLNTQSSWFTDMMG